MPYTKKRRYAGSGLMPGVRKLARAVNSEIRDKKAIAEAAEAAQLAQALTAVPAQQNWLQGRADARRKYGGMGMYTGHGGFFGDLGHTLFDKIGPTGLGDLGQLGRGLGNAFGSWAGMGAYDQRASNSLIPGGSNTIGVPAFASSGGESGCITITHREYVTDVYGNASGSPFTVQSYSLNPGLEQTFPWLSQLAQNYDEYTFKQLMFSYRSTISDIGSSTTGQVGTIIMATNYNAAAAPFSDKVSMMEYEAAMSAKTTEHQLHGVECDPSKKSLGPEGLYVRTNPVIPNQDIKTYDWGKFQIAVSNTPTAAGSSFANQAIGELWVSYTVELRKPKFFTNRGLGNLRDEFASGTTPGTQALFNNLLTGQQNNIGVKLTQGNQNVTLTFPAVIAGLFRVMILLSGTALTSTQVSSSAITGQVKKVADLIAGQVGSPGALYTDVNAGSSAVLNGLMYIGDFSVLPASSGVDNSVTISFGGTLSGSLAHSQCSIVEINASGLKSLTDTGNVVFLDADGAIKSPV